MFTKNYLRNMTTLRHQHIPSSPSSPCDRIYKQVNIHIVEIDDDLLNHESRALCLENVRFTIEFKQTKIGKSQGDGTVAGFYTLQ